MTDYMFARFISRVTHALLRERGRAKWQKKQPKSVILCSKYCGHIEKGNVGVFRNPLTSFKYSCLLPTELTQISFIFYMFKWLNS